MIKLRLCEYNKDGKFERFLELGSNYGNFFYCGDCIGIWDESPEIKNGKHYFKDEKDPLNRFDGLFDGRTYSEGRFILILNIGKIFQDDVLKSRWLGGDLEVASNQPLEDRYDFLPDEVIGNLHENPELFLKI